MSTDSIQQPEFGPRETNPITSVEEYEFEPIKGYPYLKWAGKRPFTSTQYYPAQHKETYGREVNGWRNKIYWGDNLQVMSHLLREYRGKVKLIYIDPPFDSKADYKKKIVVRGKEAISDRDVFEEKQYTDIWTNDEYLQFMYDRLILLRELLSLEGTLYVHCNQEASPSMRIILDEIFGNKNHLNDVIWHFENKPKFSFSKVFPRDWEIILAYAKSFGNHYFQHALVPVKEVQQQAIVAWDPVAKKRIAKRDEEGNIIYETRTEKLMGAVWTLPIIHPIAHERLDYPTQKPEALLERIIKASSEPGDLVLDCFMGSGTTQAVAMKLGRRFIGADINLGAVQITTKRLLTASSAVTAQSQKLISEDNQPSAFYTGFEVYNVNNYEIFRNPVQAKDLLRDALEVNPLPPGSLFDGEKDGRMVKIMAINRIATRQDLNELITGFDNKTFEKRYKEHPNRPVEKITLVCMGHESDLAAYLQKEMAPFKLDVQIVDILRDKQDLHFKRDSEAQVITKDGYLIIEQFYPLNLLGKLSEQKEDVIEWRELVDSIMVDWNYDGAVLQPAILDVPEGNALVRGRYKVPDAAGTILVKITDLLSESLEVEIDYA